MHKQLIFIWRKQFSINADQPIQPYFHAAFELQKFYFVSYEERFDDATNRSFISFLVSINDVTFLPKRSECFKFIIIRTGNREVFRHETKLRRSLFLQCILHHHQLLFNLCNGLQ